MSEPMVRVLSAWCPVHGERMGNPPVTLWGEEPEEAGVHSADELRQPGVGCAACLYQGIEQRLLLATESAT